jgi:hypothetical protein
MIQLLGDSFCCRLESDVDGEMFRVRNASVKAGHCLLFLLFCFVLFKEWGEAESLVTAASNYLILADRRMLISHIGGVVSGPSCALCTIWTTLGLHLGLQVTKPTMSRVNYGKAEVG